MSRVAEALLYALARKMYRSELGHSEEMKQSLQSADHYAAYRAGKSQEVAAACRRYHVPLAGRVLLDLGCNDGAISPQYLELGAREVIGVDIDAEAIARAQRHAQPGVRFLTSHTDGLPLEDQSVDCIICYDVFEHVSRPGPMLEDCYRVLRPGGQLVIATWGWYHPFAPHLWSTMPVPWAHLFFSERTVLRTCRRVYHSSWYQANMHDLDAAGQKKPDKYTQESISTDYLNKYLIRDFERVFRASRFQWELHPLGFGSRWARWTHGFLHVPWLREFVTAAIWVVLTRPAGK